MISNPHLTVDDRLVSRNPLALEMPIAILEMVLPQSDDNDPVFAVFDLHGDWFLVNFAFDKIDLAGLGLGVALPKIHLTVNKNLMYR